MRTNFPRSSRSDAPSFRAGVRALLGATALALGLSACGAAVDGPTDDVVIELVALATTSTETQITRLDGATVGGEVTVAVRATGNLERVDFRLDGTHVGEATGEPFAITLDTTAVADGAHTLTADAILTNGRVRTTRATLVVANGGVEPTVPGARYEVPAATLYVATDGDDANDGRAVDRPLRSLTRAAQIVQPGDVVYLRGGVYPIQVRFDRSGTESAPIVWTSYPGEWAVLDGSDQTPVASGHRVWVAGARWNVFANFEVRASPQEGIQLYDAHDNLFTNIVTHGNHYSGILVMQSDRNRFEYVTTYGNYDEFNQWGRQGDDADGISISSGDRNVLYRMVAYGNSDDGLDTWRSTNTVIDSSISFGNGRGAYGNGNGVKAGGNGDVVNTLVVNSIAFGNKANGFDDNTGRGVRFVNNTSFDNGGYDFAFGGDTVLRNNLAHGGAIGAWGGSHVANSWNLGIGDPAFLSTDPDDASFLALSAGSRAIDAGVDVGLPYAGAAPDLGAIEHEQVLADVLGAPLTAAQDPAALAALGR